MNRQIRLAGGAALVISLACNGGENETETESGTETGTQELEDAPIGGNPELVDFPSGYQESALYTTVDRMDTQQVRRMFANAAAIDSPPGALDRGSVVVMEIWKAKLAGDGSALLDDHGRLVADELSAVAVMEKQEGFGNYTEATKNGEWEYAFFSAEGEATDSELDCYGCHLEQAGAAVDYMFTLAPLEAWQTEPAPMGGTTDLLNFPADYLSYSLATTVERADTKQVRDIYANDVAVASADGDFARGSVIVMAIFTAELDGDEEPVLDMNGQYIRDQLAIVAVMEKQQGFGNYTPETRNGEWEHAFFTPEGEPLASEADCYGCHLDNAAASDFVFTKAAIAAL